MCESIDGWVLADDDSYQWVLEVDDQTYELIETRLVNPEKKRFGMFTNTIYLTDYTQEEITTVISGFGYASTAEIRETYGETANRIIAECVFEQSRAVGPIFRGTHQQVRRFIDMYMAGTLEEPRLPDEKQREKKTPSGDRDHPGWKLSRECICDTYIAKRTGVMRQSGLLRELTAVSFSSLRQTQLAPHVEKKMTAGRYLDMQRRKQSAPTVVVVLRDSLIEEIYSSNPYTKVLVADYDLYDPNDEQLEMRYEAEDLVAAGGMHRISI